MPEIRGGTRWAALSGERTGPRTSRGEPLPRFKVDLDSREANFALSRYCQFHESCRAQMIWFWFREFASQRGAGAVGAANEERAQSRRAAARQRPVLALKPSPPGPPPLSGRGGAPRGA